MRSLKTLANGLNADIDFQHLETLCGVLGHQWELSPSIHFCPVCGRVRERKLESNTWEDSLEYTYIV